MEAALRSCPRAGDRRRYHLRPALSAAPARGTRRSAARLRRPQHRRVALRPRRIPGRDRGGGRADPTDTWSWLPGDHDDDDPRHERSLSFGSEAAAYERGRPSYPPEAIDWLLPDGRPRRARPRRRHRQADHPTGRTRSGRGGGRSARRDARGAEHARCRTPRRCSGTAEDIPLPTTASTRCWWPRPGTGSTRRARCPRWRGCCAPAVASGLVWNTRDERSGWVKDLGRIIGHEDDPFSQQVSLPAPFAEIERHQVEWTNYLTPQALIDLVASRSYCITSPDEGAHPRRSIRCANCWPPIPRWPIPPAWRCRMSRCVLIRRHAGRSLGRGRTARPQRWQLVPSGSMVQAV